ncbi:MAG: amidohydrolase [Planctomycetota bacterium]|nr:MAG: amidohydrolase [Planctomycetota bacterium]
MRVDIHTHILPERWPDLRERYGYGGFVQLEHHGPGCAHMTRDGAFFRKVEPNCWDPATRLRECDEAGVDVQVLSTVPIMFSYWAKPHDTHDLARLLNDDIAETVRAHPRRFVGLGTLPMQDPELAVRELERCVEELDLAGVEIGSHIGAWNLNAPELFCVFERCAELGAAVFVHPWDMMGMDTLPDYWLPWLVSMPAETSRAICSLIFGGVFERLPDLRVAFAHGGGSFPATIGRIERGFVCRPDLTQVHNQRNPREYLGRFWCDSLVHDATMLRYLVDLIGARRVALGSDYPFPLGEMPTPGALIDSLDFDDETRAQLLGKSALEWLGLSEERFLE